MTQCSFINVLVIDVYTVSLIMKKPEGIRYFIREDFITGANYVIDNTKKERDVKSSVG